MLAEKAMAFDPLGCGWRDKLNLHALASVTLDLQVQEVAALAIRLVVVRDNTGGLLDY